MLDYAEKAGKKYRTDRVAISSAGIVDGVAKKVFQAPQCYEKKVAGFSFLEKADFKVFLENDGRSFGWGSFVFELKKKPKTVLSLAFGTGIGGGLIVGGENYQGAHFSSLEFSHVFWGQPKKMMNKSENWEDLAGGRGLEKQYALLTQERKTAFEIFELAKKKDQSATRVLRIAKEQIALGVANLINILDPEVIVLGGTMVTERKKYFKEAIQESQKWIFNQKIKPKVVFSSLGEKANLLGVGDLARKNLL